MDLSKAFLQEAKWKHNKNIPEFKDYIIIIGLQSIVGVLLLVHSDFLVNQTINKRELELLEYQHNLLRWPSIICRLYNDLATSSYASNFLEVYLSYILRNKKKFYC